MLAAIDLSRVSRAAERARWHFAAPTSSSAATLPVPSLPRAQVKSVEPLELSSGHLQVMFEDDATYDLRAANGKQCTQWIDALEERAEWARHHPPNGDKRRGRGGGSSASSTSGSAGGRWGREMGRGGWRK